MATKKDFSHQASMKEYWEEQATFSNDPVKIVRTLPEDTPEFILTMMTEFEIDVAKFCFDDGHSGLILDAGCGTGNIPMHALRLYPENRCSPSIVATSVLHQSYTKPPKYISPFWFINQLKKLGFNMVSYRGFNFGLFSGYRYLFMDRWKIFNPFFIQKRWSRFIERKIVPHMPKISFLGHRIYVKCRK